MLPRCYCRNVLALIVLVTVHFAGNPRAVHANEIRKIQWRPLEHALRFEVTLAELVGFSVTDRIASEGSLGLPKGALRLEIADVNQPFKNQDLRIRDDRIRKCTLSFDEKKKLLAFTFYPAAGVTAQQRTESKPVPRIIIEFSASSSSGKEGEKSAQPRGAAGGAPGRKCIVIIDPGHGGSSLGAYTRRKIGGSQLVEKTIVLALAKMLQKMVNETPTMTAYLTRDDDASLSLRARREIAERYEGDFFVSIHCNSTPGNRPSPARGVEFYYWNDKGSDDAAVRWLEEQENADEIETAINHNSSLRGLLKNLLKDQLDVQAAQSAQACALLQKSFQTSRYFAKYCRGIKSARFQVLENYSMPSVLVEVGFLSNYEEAKMLKDAQFQQHVASLLLQGIRAQFEQ
jgi:N-acetylmuramoyl-L-alanine amidase